MAMDPELDFIDHAQLARQQARRGVVIADTANLERVSRLAAYLQRDLAEIGAAAGYKADFPGRVSHCGPECWRCWAG